MVFANAFSVEINYSNNGEMKMENVKVANKKIVFLKDANGWYADMEGSRGQNAMVSGADVMIEAVSNGKRRVEMVFSADVEKPGDHIMKLHRVEHDPWGATYRVSDGTGGNAPQFRGILGLPLVWLCNQTEKFVGGEHPVDIYVHSILAA